MSRSSDLLARARQLIPGGVNSPVRAFAAVGGDPPFIRRGEGAEIEDEDGNRYLDLVGSWGALLLGHAHPAVVAAAVDAVRSGSSFGAPTAGEVAFAEAVVDRVPGLAKVRAVSSGTEATMHAIRLARGFTGRDRIIKMEGCYHGAHDAMLVKAGSGVATFGHPGSPGVPAVVAGNTLLAPFNDADAVGALFEAYPGEIAAVMLEPVAGNMGTIPPRAGYLQALRALCDAHGALLILDEVMTGFRVHRNCSPGLYGVEGDLSCYGKVVGGGFPLAVFGGRADVMDHLAPDGPVYQAGTLSGNPVAVAAGRAALEALTPEVYAHLDRLGDRLEAHLRPQLAEFGCSLHRVGAMFTVFFRPTAPWSFSEVGECDFDAFARYFRAAQAEGVYLPPSQYEAAFLNAAMTTEQIDRIAEVLIRAARSATAGG
ncbi:MAG: glutamate-1-semialdehyde 2,1-aminomutase [Myxococcota bacterium]|jgi:glutamate-1-semialdehyde 2,1-aminomutase